jgi:CelD/BcsL family acetyltransferase involved in cellulose biosynthesis
MPNRNSAPGTINSQWNSIIDHDSDALVFHSPAWLEMIAKCYSLQPHHLELQNSAGSALLPLFLSKSLLFGRKVTTQPFNFYGGLLSTSDDATREILGKARKVWKETNARFLEIKNVRSLNASLVKEFNLIERSPVVRYVVPLRDNAEEFDRQLKRRFREKLNKLQRQASTAGLSIEDAGPDTEPILRNFYDLLTDEYKFKHLMLVQPFRLFRMVAKGLSKRFHLYIAKLNGKVIGGAIILRFKDADYYLWGAYDQKFEEISPLTLVLAEAMKQGREDGIKTFDLGVTSRSHEGLNFFKSRWGGVCEPLNYYYFANRDEEVPHLDYFNSFRTARQAIRYVPRRVIQQISPLVINWLA